MVAGPSLLQKHINTVLTAGVLGILSWVGVTVNNLSHQMAVIEVQMEAVQDASRTANLSRYTASDASRDSALVQVKIDEIQRRISVLEREQGS